MRYRITIEEKTDPMKQEDLSKDLWLTIFKIDRTVGNKDQIKEILKGIIDYI